MEVSGRRRTDSAGRKTSLLCDPCKGENKGELGVSYCTVCNEYLCPGCRKAHKKTTVTKCHLLMDRDSMPKHKPTSAKDSICLKHGDKPIEFFCKSDSQFCCYICTTIDHKQCTVQYIDEIATDFHKSNDYADLKKATVDLIRLLEETKDKATRNMKDLETIHESFISDLQQFRTEINNKLDSLEKAAMKEVQIVKDSENKGIDYIAKKCDLMLYDIHNLSSKLEEQIRYKQERQLVIRSKKGAETVRTYINRVNGLIKQNKVKNYKFEPNKKIHNFLLSLDGLGVMKDESEPSSKTTCADVSVKSSHQPITSYVGNIDVRHSTDKRPCGFTGGVMIDQTKLAMVDQNNFSVKVADVDNNTLISCLQLPTQPFDITCVNRDQIVVTCSDQRQGKLFFLKVGKSLSVLKELDTGRFCQGVVYSNNTFIVSFGRPEPSVKIFNMNGKVLKLFETNKAGTALFSDPVYICLSTDQKAVFVSDRSNHTVMSLTLDGAIQNVYNADSLERPQDLAVDRNGNLYIAGCDSQYIYQISTEGNRSQGILDEKSGVVDPWMMTYCKTRHRLYVSVVKDGGHEVSVYQIHR